MIQEPAAVLLHFAHEPEAEIDPLAEPVVMETGLPLAVSPGDPRDDQRPAGITPATPTTSTATHRNSSTAAGHFTFAVIAPPPKRGGLKTLPTWPGTLLRHSRNTSNPAYHEEHRWNDR